MTRLTQLIVPGLALVASVAGRPAPKAQAEERRAVTIVANIAAPTRHVGQVIYQNSAGQPTLTTTDTVVVIPTPAPPAVPSASVTPEDIENAKTTLNDNVSISNSTVLNSNATINTNTNITITSGGTAVIEEPIADAGVVPGSSNATLHGVSYTVYTSDSGCKSQNAINSDLARLKDQYAVVRIYGTDCNQVRTVYQGMTTQMSKGTQLFLGVYNIDQADKEVNDIIAGIDGDWDSVHTVSVGNELVNSGRATPEQVISALRSARAKLRAAGYNGPVVTVDTFNAVEANPELCEESDYCAFNAHPFFDATSTASEAGPWLSRTVHRVESILSSPKRIVVTETGWPTQGMANGLAVPSFDNQKDALNSIRSAFASNPGDLILFSAYDDLWKAKSPATFNVEPYWGIGGAKSIADQ